MVGEWRVHADIDPDNRVLIVSNLKMKSSSIANNLLANEKFIFNMHLEQEGETVTDNDFLKLITMKVELIDSDGNENLLTLSDDGEGADEAAADGIYTVELSAPSVDGITEVSAWVESPTFQRMRQLAINVFDSPVTTDVQVSEELEVPHKLIFTPIERVSKAFTLQIDLDVEMPDGVKKSLGADLDKGYSQFAELDVIEKGGQYKVQLQISGETPSGRVFNVSPPSFTFTSKDLTPEEIPVEEPVEEEKPDLTFYLLLGLGVNIILIILGWLIAKLIKKKNLTQANKMSEQLG